MLESDKSGGLSVFGFDLHHEPPKSRVVVQKSGLIFDEVAYPISTKLWSTSCPSVYSNGRQVYSGIGMCEM